ncbi:MAG: HAMP domain-containing histidine kinase [Oscillospiraceae bacterium]|nr:HAMP domain-containing histidine kinase [Oscillospiraceae bacterium]
MSRKMSLYSSNRITVVSILLISFLILGIVFLLLGYRVVINDKRDQMNVMADEAELLVSAYVNSSQLDDLELRMGITSLARASGFHIILCNSDGTVVNCSDKEINCQHIGMRLDPEMIISTISKSGKANTITDMGGLYTEKRYVKSLVLAVGNNLEIRGYIILSAPVSSMLMLWRDFCTIFLIVLGAVIIVAIALSFASSKRMAKPINDMAIAAYKFGRGDFSSRIDYDGNIDEIGELAEAFNNMADALEQSETKRRELIANVSHELKTPMTSITGFAEGILDGTIPEERQEKYLAIIASEARRLSRLVAGMLKMSQFQSQDSAAVLKQNSFEATEVILSALVSLEKKIESKNLDVDARIPEEAVSVLGDRDSINQVVYNLLDNAVKFAPEGSTIGLELYKQGPKAYISVENQGETISREELPLIFDRFHKTDKSRSKNTDGVGLGLYIVKTILDNHDESIFVSSHDGLTKFTFTLTIKPAAKASSGKTNS